MPSDLTIANLTHPQEIAFVAAVVALGGPQHGATAALQAGYSDDEREASDVAERLLSARRIRSAIAGETRSRFEAAAPAAFTTLMNVCINGRSESARITAAQEILNRAIGPIPSRSVALMATATVEELIAMLDKSTEEKVLNGEYEAG
ncbi:hypothetical protein [Mesorhizobium koreense]|uniref:hypothetical protein n=1 Tax=Mesorhizobium koreense TaxID=3074855 RepID=UPI00287B7265|nr:hypothetical protein [Mesorhizobium sp. WR6]